MTMKKLLLAAALIALPVAALHAMTVAVFLEKADALKSRGALALFSSDLGLLKGEMQTAGAALRAERLAAERAGRRPALLPARRARAVRFRRASRPLPRDSARAARPDAGARRPEVAAGPQISLPRLSLSRARPARAAA